ncbi:hypothetical protein AB0D67_32625 [Streptosporangium sp. NPDC048047]|uniref:hypothetical protein n=1 Tax=Streptosporangium sp. NPDC048047 TaxID=3155748 RepID=UPI003442A4D0
MSQAACVRVLSISGALAAARRQCTPECFCYHATWRIFRLAGLKGNPTWHTGFYARALAEHPVRPRARVLVCGSSDETMPRVLAALLDNPVLIVADACRTPLALAGAWGHRTGTMMVTVRSRAPHLEGISERFDVIVTDGLLSLLPSAADRQALIARLAGLLAPSGLLLYTTRIAGTSGRLEYDRIGRLVQALAAAAWPGPAAQCYRLARHRLRAASRPSPFATPGQVADAFRSGFGQVRLFTCAAPASTALGLHPASWVGRVSTCAAVAATTPLGSRP